MSEPPRHVKLSVHLTELAVNLCPNSQRYKTIECVDLGLGINNSESSVFVRPSCRRPSGGMGSRLCSPSDRTFPSDAGTRGPSHNRISPKRALSHHFCLPNMSVSILYCQNSLHSYHIMDLSMQSWTVYLSLCSSSLGIVFSVSACQNSRCTSALTCYPSTKSKSVQ